MVYEGCRTFRPESGGHREEHGVNTMLTRDGVRALRKQDRRTDEAQQQACETCSSPGALTSRPHVGFRARGPVRDNYWQRSRGGRSEQHCRVGPSTIGWARRASRVMVTT